MTLTPPLLTQQEGQAQRAPDILLLLALVAIALVSAREYAGGWNDGSRLASVESLVDYHTLRIEQSIFVQVPRLEGPSARGPYPSDEPFRYGTQDKLYIDGHFYSDKSPVPALLMGALYQAIQWGTGLRARERPDLFCYWITVGSSGVAYIVAVWCLYKLAGLIIFSLPLRLAFTASFGLSTMALPYTRHVNNHILLLAVTSALFLGLVRLALESRAGAIPSTRVWTLGSLTGLGYSIDLAAGPVLLACIVPLIVYRCRNLKLVGIFILAALPWLGLHHVVNYALGGTFQPANAVPAYLQWPGSPFTARSMTGPWNHPSVGHFFVYAIDLLIGKRGFLGHNLPLFLTLVGAMILLRRRAHYFPEIVCASCFAVGTWLIYAVFSTNYSGAAASIRWFVPLLAPAYLILAIFLREQPQYWRDLLILSAWGSILAGLMWWDGPWMKHMVPFFWLLLAAGLLSWAYVRVRASDKVGPPYG